MGFVPVIMYHVVLGEVYSCVEGAGAGAWMVEVEG